MQKKDIQEGGMYHVSPKFFHARPADRRIKPVLVKALTIESVYIKCQSLDYKAGSTRFLKPIDLRPLPGNTNATQNGIRADKVRSLAEEIFGK